MDRLTFSKMLVQSKIASGMNGRDMIMRMNMLPNGILRIEKAVKNYSVATCFRYLNATGYVITLAKKERSFVIHDPDEAHSWLFFAAGMTSDNKLADLLGCCVSTVRNARAKRNKLSIDIFLKAAEVFGYKLTLVEREDGEQRLHDSEQGAV